MTDLSDSIDTLKALVEPDEWFDQESIISSKATFTVRVKTDRLDAFVDALNSAFQARKYTKDGQDISLSYQDKTIRIESITLQIERLQVLYASASLSEMITINSELADLETELLVLQGQLSVYDS